MKSSDLQRCFWHLLLNVYRRFDSQSPVVLECSTLQLSHYNTSKRWWPHTTWLNDVRSQENWVLINFAVITWNGASKQYCLLQVLMAALLLVSRAAFVKRYPDPQNGHKYYLRIDDSFYNLTCPKSLVFDQYKQQCTLNNYKLPDITPLLGNACSQTKEGYYCSTPFSFTYCTHDNMEIIKDAPCHIGLSCKGPPNIKPCGP